MGKWFRAPNLRSSKVMDVAEAAYFAGIIDGEGTISVYRGRRKESKKGYRFNPLLSVANTDLDALFAIRDLCGNGRLQQATNPKPHHKKGYVLRFSPNQIRHLLPQVLPFLLMKRRQAEFLLEFLGLNIAGRNMNPQQQFRADEVTDALRGLNRRGITIQ